MLTYTMDVEDRSRWLISTPSEEVAAQPYFCSEVGDFYARKRFVTERDRKDSFIVFYTLGGCGIVRQGGQEILLEKGHALLMDCRTPQSYATSPTRNHWYHLWTHVDGVGVSIAGDYLGLPRLVPIAVPLARIQPHFDTLFHFLSQESVTSRAITGAAVHSLLTELVVASREELHHGLDDPVQIACDFVHAHYAEGICLQDIADAASVSPSHLIRLFRRQIGTTPHDYLMRHRITRAKELLAETTLTSAVIADAASVSPSHLIRLFKRQIGTTPHDYLMRHRITRAKELLAETTLTSAVIARQVGFASESNFSYRFTKMVGQGPRAWRLGSPGSN